MSHTSSHSCLETSPPSPIQPRCSAQMDMNMNTMYEVPRALTILSGIFLALGALGMLIVTIDILLRQGWKTMMWIM